MAAVTGPNEAGAKLLLRLLFPLLRPFPKVVGWEGRTVGRLCTTGLAGGAVDRLRLSKLDRNESVALLVVFRALSTALPNPFLVDCKSLFVDCNASLVVFPALLAKSLANPPADLAALLVESRSVAEKLVGGLVAPNELSVGLALRIGGLLGAGLSKPDRLEGGEACFATTIGLD